MDAGHPLAGRVAFVTGAARGIGRGIALALARQGADVAVADLHPAPFRGERYFRMRERISGDEEKVATAEAVRDAVTSRTPVGRLGETGEIGALVAFLASEAAGFITAAAIPCDGGLLGAPVSGMLE